MVLPDLKTGAILQALGETLPEADLSRLRDFLSGVAPLDVSDADARRIVDALKTAADRHWQINPHRSVELADAIIAVGEDRDDTWIRALGTMAKGDAIKLIGSQQEAWELLEEAARLFSSIDDEVGLARTWVGRLPISAQLNRLPEALAQAARAQEIFERHGEITRQIWITQNLGVVHWQTENLAAAESELTKALNLAIGLGVDGEEETVGIYHNLGLVALSRGDPYRALEYFGQAVRLAEKYGEESEELICRLSVAQCKRDLGQFRQALALLHEIQPRYRALRGFDTHVQDVMAECLWSLDRLEEAAALCGQARKAWLLRFDKLLSSMPYSSACGRKARTPRLMNELRVE